MSGLDLPLIAAFGAGILSFLSPCVLPLVPAYLSYMAGTQFDDLVTDVPPAGLRRRVLIGAFAFVAGFSVVFMAMGATASVLSQALLSWRDVLAQVAGAVIIVFGLHMMGLFRIGVLLRTARLSAPAGGGPLAPFGVGVAFAFGWTPCIGPILATILTVAASRDSLGAGTLLLGLYSLGLGVPFVLAALAVQPFMRFMARARRQMRRLEIATGAVMALTGLAILTGRLGDFGFWLIETFPILGKIG